MTVTLSLPHESSISRMITHANAALTLLLESTAEKRGGSAALPMTRQQRLRRVALLCCHFTRNLAYYRSGWSSGQLLPSSEFLGNGQWKLPRPVRA